MKTFNFFSIKKETEGLYLVSNMGIKYPLNCEISLKDISQMCVVEEIIIEAGATIDGKDILTISEDETNILNVVLKDYSTVIVDFHALSLIVKNLGEIEDEKTINNIRDYIIYLDSNLC